jgi:hypothetical protein
MYNIYIALWLRRFSIQGANWFIAIYQGFVPSGFHLGLVYLGIQPENHLLVFKTFCCLT